MSHNEGLLLFFILGLSMGGVIGFFIGIPIAEWIITEKMAKLPEQFQASQFLAGAEAHGTTIMPRDDTIPQREMP